jgi:hypothetical protein
MRRPCLFVFLSLCGCAPASVPSPVEQDVASALPKYGPDLVPYLIVPTRDILVPPPACGESFTFGVRNQGDKAIAEVSIVRVEASIGASPAHPVLVKVPPLAAGETVQLEAPVRALPHVRVVVDVGGVVAETQEQNNTLEYDCTLDCGTDATGGALSLTRSPPIMCPGRRSYYDWTDVYDARRTIETPVFPGAEGFGTDTPGGDLDVLIRVDTLADNATSSTGIAQITGPDLTHCIDAEPASGTPCTFRTAVSAQLAYTICGTIECPRTVVFEVGGPIVLVNHIDIVAPYLTVAGQTAPAPGIHVVGDMLQVRTHDVVLRHLAVLPASCMAEPLAYCLSHAECDPDEACISRHCRKRCSTNAECNAAGYRGFNRAGVPAGIPDRGTCVEVDAALLPTQPGPARVCSCNDTHAIVPRDAEPSHYSWGTSCPGPDQQSDDALCHPRRRGSTATARCVCGDLCNQLVVPGDLEATTCDPSATSCCMLAQKTADALGCAFDSDCDDRIAQVCGNEVDCQAACLGGLCAPMKPPRPDREVHHLVFDHLTLGWANDEIISTAFIGIHDLTINNSILAMGENLGNTKAVVPHSMGSIVLYHTMRMSMIGNLFAHLRGRHPVLGQNVSALVANNVIYNPGADAIALTGPSRLGPALLSVDTQLVLTGPDTLLVPSGSGGTLARTDQFGFTYSDLHNIAQEPLPTQLPLVHAWFDAHPESEVWVGDVYDEWGARQVLYSNTKYQGISHRQGGPHLLTGPDRTVSVSPLTLASSCDELYSGVLARAGARPGGVVESVIVQDVLTRSGAHPDEVICERTGASVTCNAHRCDAAGCRILHSFVLTPSARRRILTASEGCSPAYPSPHQTTALQLPCGAIPMRDWMEALSDGLEATPDTLLKCP